MLLIHLIVYVVANICCATSVHKEPISLYGCNAVCVQSLPMTHHTAAELHLHPSA